MTFRCETCGTGLVYKGGPYKPRWCGEHRAEGWKVEHRARQARYRGRMQAVEPPVYCQGCHSRLLEPADMCGFCMVEIGAANEAELVAA